MLNSDPFALYIDSTISKTEMVHHKNRKNSGAKNLSPQKLQKWGSYAMDNIEEIKNENIVLKNKVAELEKEVNELRQEVNNLLDRLQDTSKGQGYNW